MDTGAAIPELPLHNEYTEFVPAPVEQVFAYADDHRSMSSHMSQSSPKMGGGGMRIELDEGQGQCVGSHIRLSGRAFGMALSVDETVTERDPPRRKAWTTTGRPKLLVVGHYRMGFETEPKDEGTLLRVFIDYALPEAGTSRWLGRLLGGYYAAWCTRQMAQDTADNFRNGAYSKKTANVGFVVK
jgi:hypothetical protein